MFEKLLDAVKGKEYPDFWIHYINATKNYKPETIENAKFIVFDCESSGLDVRNDRILSIGAVTIKNKNIKVNQVFEYYVKQDVFKRESAVIHGLLKNHKDDQKEEEEVVKEFLKYIEGSIIVGHHVGFDMGLVNYALKRIGLPKLVNPTLDTGNLFKKTKHEIYADVYNKHFTLDELCDELKITKKDRHTASGDAYLTAIVFLKIIGRLKKTQQVSLKDLFYIPKMRY